MSFVIDKSSQCIGIELVVIISPLTIANLEKHGYKKVNHHALNCILKLRLWTSSQK